MYCFKLVINFQLTYSLKCYFSPVPFLDPSNSDEFLYPKLTRTVVMRVEALPVSEVHLPK